MRFRNVSQSEEICGVPCLQNLLCRRLVLTWFVFASYTTTVNEQLKARGIFAEDILPATEADEFQISFLGGVPLERSSCDPELNEHSSEQLLHGGEHFDDVPRTVRRCLERTDGREQTPREVMVEIVQCKLLKRPLPSQWQRNWKLQFPVLFTRLVWRAHFN